MLELSWNGGSMERDSEIVSVALTHMSVQYVCKNAHMYIRRYAL